ncbi:MAG: lysozyme inhibitor LprI family protein [Gammaproteobacteria bacterium]
MRAVPQSLGRDACIQPSSLAMMTECSQTEYIVADNTLNEVYQQFTAAIEKASTQIWDKIFSNGYKKALGDSENAWIKFRDADCNFFNL